MTGKRGFQEHYSSRTEIYEQVMEKLTGTPKTISNAAVDQRVVRLWGRTALDVTLLVALVGFTSWLGYIGFIASDDWSYSEAAIGWLEHFPYVGTNHWGLRHAVVLPVALSFLVRG